MDGKQITERSLRQDLNRWLIGITLTISTVAGAIAGVVAFFEARDIQDEVLIQFANLIDDDIISYSPSQRDLPDSHIIIQPLSVKGPLKIDADIANGFNTLEGEEESWRVYIISHQDDGTSTR